jgi:hypothetical protein
VTQEHRSLRVPNYPFAPKECDVFKVFFSLHYTILLQTIFFKHNRCFLYSTVNFTTNNAHCQIAQSVERLQCVAVMESNASSTPSNDVHKRADSYKVRKYQNTKSKTMETQEHRSLRVTNYPFCKINFKFCDVFV